MNTDHPTSTYPPAPSGWRVLNYEISRSRARKSVTLAKRTFDVVEVHHVFWWAGSIEREATIVLTRDDLLDLVTMTTDQ